MNACFNVSELLLDFCKLETGLGEIGNLGSNAAGV